jgi:hypothetical protein
VPALLTLGPRAFWRAFRLPDHIHLTGGFRLENAKGEVCPEAAD